MHCLCCPFGQLEYQLQKLPEGEWQHDEAQPAAQQAQPYVRRLRHATRPCAAIAARRDAQRWWPEPSSADGNHAPFLQAVLV
jgi:hypothetical protein